MFALLAVAVVLGAGGGCLMSVDVEAVHFDDPESTAAMLGSPINPLRGLDFISSASIGAYMLVGSVIDCSFDPVEVCSVASCTPGFGISVGYDSDAYIRGVASSAGVFEIYDDKGNVQFCFIFIDAPLEMEGIGSVSDPYHGCVDIDVGESHPDEIWVTEGTGLWLHNDDFMGMYSSDLGYSCDPVSSWEPEVIMGLASVGDYQLNGSEGTIMTIHVVPDVPELVFESDPSTGTITYVGAPA